jgi:ceramide glucosyltransferase
VVTDPDGAINPKVAQLLSLDRMARGEVLVVSDSNVRVPPDYIESLLSEFRDPKVGVVCSLFVGTGEATAGAALENLQLGTMVTAGIVAAATVTGKVLTVGKSMAMRREHLRAVGGFEAVGSVLAEDHVLGCVFSEAGFETRLCACPVENRNVGCSVARTIERHTRWAKIRRSISAPAFAFEPLLSPLLTSTLVFCAWPSHFSAKACLLALLIQLAGAFTTMRVLRGRMPRWTFASFEILRTYVLFFCWARAWASRRVSWRGHDYQIGSGTRITPREITTWQRVRTFVRA